MVADRSRAAELSEGELGELVELVRALIRIPTVNPPGDEIRAARYLEQILADAGLRPTVFEPFPGRGSIVCRVRGDGSRGRPLLLLSHLDVVPAPAAGWTHDPFGAELEGGYIWGRGAIDMKSMVAMEVQIIRGLAARARSAGRDPATDPVPDLGRDVIFAATADEEAGGWQGANWLVNEHPDLLAAEGALNEVGAIPVPFAGTRFYPIQVAEKGGIVYRLTVHGRWGHGSMPTNGNAAVLAAQVVGRLAEPEPPHVGKVVAAALAAALPHLPAGVIGALAAPGRPVVARAAGRGLRPALRRLPRSTVRELVERAMRRPGDLDGTIERLCDPAFVPAASALLRNTISVGILNAGLKYNVIPGIATIELDVRTLPGVSETAMTAEIRRRIGPELEEHVDVEVVAVGPAVEAPLAGELYPLLERTLRDHDRAAVPIPLMVPWVTDAKHVARIGVPTYGFSPLKLGHEDNALAMLHGDNERVSVDALRWGLPVLADVVERFCATLPS